MNDTNNTESADDQVDVGKAVSDQLSCSLIILFYGLTSIAGGIILLKLLS